MSSDVEVASGARVVAGHRRTGTVAFPYLLLPSFWAARNRMRRRERGDQKPVPGDHDRHDHAKNARDDPATQRTAKGVSRRLAQSVGAAHVPGRREHAPGGRQEDRADKFTLGDDVPGEDGQCWYDEDVYTPAGLPDTVYVIGCPS